MARARRDGIDLGGGGERIGFEVDGRAQVASYTWFRGESTNFNPKRADLLDEDAVLRHVLAGWLPPEPAIGPHTRLTAFGSCFAQHIADWLRARDYTLLTDREGGRGDVYVVRFGEGMVNSFALRQQFEWAFEGIVPREELWHDYDARAHGYDERIRRQTEEMFRATDVFILTLGLSEVWYDTVTGGVFWRAVPQNRYDPSRHRFRVSTVAENRENLAAIHRLIATHRPEAKVILTLSPVPLVATFRPVSCITANSASKAILRAALDEFLREADDPARLFYWPSYEIVTGVFDEPFKPDRRHVKEAVLGFVMTLFEHAWCSGAAPRHSLLEAWVGAQAAAGPLPRPVLKAVEARDAAALDDHASRLAARGNPAAADLLARLAREYRAPAAGDATG